MKSTATTVDDNLCILCNNIQIIRTSWTDANLGQRFASCSDSECTEFNWVEPPMCRKDDVRGQDEGI
ncbi:hypothetical protein RHMOL_Rhmol07G0146500 [Rhododendron molle]|uniref:Uncharacterized protein n=1 Tax=Rhododendron molle TaxID=49168 RepID=A0ACC0N209_RHOML|nr:hypothetical protein RHMOL_Rhmol07G0146500 [Rhododendron molle]